MKRYLFLAIVTLLAATSILLAQQSGQATLRTPSGDKPLSTIHQNAMTFFSASDVIAALGGTVTPDNNGFKTAIRAPHADQTHEDPNVSRTTFSGNDLRIQLAAPDVVGDAYRLENPFRVVLDLRKAAAPAPGTPPPAITRPVESPGIHTIVIDPGHGGKDVGALGPGGTMEKDATLALCRKLAASLGAKTGARVVLTREDDSLVSLDQRTAIANQYKADLFLSVHMNAAVVKGARGSETYYLSLEASDELARKAAERENAAATTPSSDLKLILWDLAQQEYVNESSRFATDIQEEMNAIAGIQNRGVKQAPFKVLVGATMPAALVEVAFISNPEEETKLKNDAFGTTVGDWLPRQGGRCE